MKFHLGIALLLAFLAGTPAHAWPPIWGPEWTFTNAEMLRDDDHVEEKFEELRDYYRSSAFKRACPDCVVVSPGLDSDGVRVILPGKELLYFEPHIDPGVVEFTARPAKLEVIKRYAPLYQKYVFDVMQKLGMRPDVRDGNGGGHDHRGQRETFGPDTYENYRFFRDYVVDRANHPELTRVYGYDRDNARALADLPKPAQDRFEELIREFDVKARRLRNPRRELILAINAQVYSLSKEPYPPDRSKYQATNLAHRATVEERSQYPQSSMDEYVGQLEIKEARLKWLRKLARQQVDLPLDLRGARALVRRGAEEPERFAHAYYRYLDEIGMAGDWENHRRRLRYPLAAVRDRCRLSDVLQALQEPGAR